MALIKCPECEKEISEFALVCPHCKKEVPDELHITIEDYEQRIYLKEQARLVKKQKQDKRKLLCKRLLISLILVVGTVSVIWLIKNLQNAGSRSNIKFYESLVGRELDEDQRLALKPSDKKYMENSTLFNVIGDASIRIPVDDPVYVTGVIWSSQESCTDSEYINVLKGFEEIYGEHQSIDKLEDVDSYDYKMTLDSIISWTPGNFRLFCQLDDENRIQIIWQKR